MQSPLLAQFFIFCLVFPTLDPAAKFEVCSFIITGDNRRSQNSKVGHATKAKPPFGPIFIFCLVFPTLDPTAKFDACSFILTGDNRGSQNSKVGHVT